MHRTLLFSLLVTFIALPACGIGHSSVSGSVSIDSGEKAKDVSTVNGGIQIAENAAARNVNTVNGSIELGKHSKAISLDTVNGGISVGESVEISDNVSTVNGGVALGKATRVAGGVSAVNGTVSLDNEVEVAGKIANVNGRIRLAASHVGGGLRTETGDIEVGANARVEGGILVKKSRTVSVGKRAPPRVVIGPGAVVGGAMRFEREVKLYVSETASIGAVEGATAVMFAGERAPE